MRLRITTIELEVEEPPKRRVARTERGPGIASCPQWDVETDGEQVPDSERAVGS